MVETYTRPSGSSFSLVRSRLRPRARDEPVRRLRRGAQRPHPRPDHRASTTPAPPAPPRPATRSLRVRLTELGSSAGPRSVTAPDSSPRTARAPASLTQETTDGAQVTRWRVVADGIGLTLQWLDEGRLAQHDQLEGRHRTAVVQHTAPARCGSCCPTAPSATTAARCARAGSGTGADSLNVVPMHSYLQSVVPPEMPPCWSTTALQVQAVAARTYAATRWRTSGRLGLRPVRLHLVPSLQGRWPATPRAAPSCSTSAAARPRRSPPRPAAASSTAGARASPSSAPRTAGRRWRRRWPTRCRKADPYDGVPVRHHEPLDQDHLDQHASRTPTRPWAPTRPADRQARRHQRLGRAHHQRDGHRRLPAPRPSPATRSARRWGCAAPGGPSPRRRPRRRASFPKDLDGNAAGTCSRSTPAGSLQLLSGNGAGAFTASRWAAGGAPRADRHRRVVDDDNRHDVLSATAPLYYHPGTGPAASSPGRDQLAGTPSTCSPASATWTATATPTSCPARPRPRSGYRGDGAGRCSTTISSAPAGTPTACLVAPATSPATACPTCSPSGPATTRCCSTPATPPASARGRR